MSDEAIRPSGANAPRPEARTALRIAVLLLTMTQMLYLAGLALFVGAPGGRSNDIELALATTAVVLLGLPFILPAFVLMARGKALGAAALLGSFATFASLIFWIQVRAEITAKVGVLSGPA